MIQQRLVETIFAIRGFEVVRLRGFWGRLKWLLTGR